ncbi:hypothetical protein CSAL01_09871 [Colletotrichum salicis]|uniref:Rhodopsin domain-containing protein n=1 Tax=Colletotrichum salicis TaxID=1209931 RepID=A0A135U0Q6_9PEZI|nr:hypothetical protein CSAL01_09871 [Colletotrichum salicis]
MDGATIHALYGTADNSGEPQPLVNKPSTILGVVIAFAYLRIFDRPSLIRSLCIYLIVFIGLWATAYSFLGWVPCVPVAAYWNWLIPAKRWAYGSLNSDIFSGTYESHSSVNFVLDVLVLAIPVPLYFRPQQSLKSKLRLLALLVIGIAVNGVSVVRVYSIIQHRSATRPTLDPMWYGPLSIVLSAVEVDLAMIASSVPIFWPVLRQRFPGIFVTKEVEVTREVRRLESVELEDDMEMEPARRSRVGSEASLRQENVNQGGGAGGRYMDEFIANQVDPLRKAKSTVTEVKAGEEVQGGWWQKGRFG